MSQEKRPVMPEDVKALREKTGAGFMNCKRALEEKNGNMEEAIKFLREKGMASASKRSGRSTRNGAVWIEVKPNVVVMAEVNSETDFVSRNEQFQSIAREVAQILLVNDPKDVDALLSLTAKQGGTLSEILKENIAKIGENIVISRFARYQTQKGHLGSYRHHSGDLGVILELESNGKNNIDQKSQLATSLGMHIAAFSPQWVHRQEVPEEVLKSEKEIYMTQAKNEGKPEAIAEKIANNKLNKFFVKNCLLEQPYVQDSSKSVEQYVQSVAPGLKIIRFARFKVGENVE